jgi:uncharacterized Zn finger protein
MWWNDRPYVSAARRQAETERVRKRLTKSGRILSPVTATGRKITTTFWGDSWCKHLESYSDYGSRLPRGRTYLRNGSVIDVQVAAGKVTALVNGSELYEIDITINPLAKSAWQKIKDRCVGQIGSMIDLLQGKLSSEVMNAVTDRVGGVFPQPKEIRMKCSCPDSARLCKHLAAVLYGLGMRFDEKPDLFFQLRGVDHLELIAEAGTGVKKPKAKAANALADDALADIFGIELATSDVGPKIRGAKAAKAKVAKPSDPVTEPPHSETPKPTKTRAMRNSAAKFIRGDVTARVAGDSQATARRAGRSNRPAKTKTLAVAAAGMKAAFKATTVDVVGELPKRKAGKRKTRSATESSKR